MLWGLVFGAGQAASPLAFWWLNTATVYALGLVLIASVYIGFAVADGRRSVLVVETSVATVFVIVAAAAVTGSPWLLVVGLAGHGLKDLWQHRRQFVANTRWWPPFCLVVDWVAATVIAVENVAGVQFRHWQSEEEWQHDVAVEVEGGRVLCQGRFGRARGGKARCQMSESSAERRVAAEPTSSYEVVVVGAGQAGLAMGYFLRRQGRRFDILERAGQIAPAWRDRWDSLTLFTPRRYSGLPGLPFPGDPDGYPTRDEVIAYLDRYAETFELPIELNSEVKRLDLGDVGRFRLEVDGRTITTDQVVVATGPFHTPYVPKPAERLADDVFQTHAVGYRRPDEVPLGTVLVVGGGNTGFQIAKELSATHKVMLSVGSRQTPLPQRPLGRDLFWWLTKARILDKSVDSRLGRKLSTRDTLIGSSPRELKKRYGVELKPRVVDADGHTVRFEDGSELEVSAVIWATGYRPDYSWIKLPIFDKDGGVRHRRGVTDVPGLYFLGLTWQYTRGSALIGWVKDDAEFIAGRIAEYQESKARASGRTPVGASATAQARSNERS